MKKELHNGPVKIKVNGMSDTGDKLYEYLR